MEWLWENKAWIGLVWSGLILVMVLFWSRLCKLNEMPSIEDVTQSERSDRQTDKSEDNRT